MNDYIERAKATHEFKTIGNIFVYGREVCKAIIDTIDSIPAADVRPVVRCGECKHWKRVKNNCFLASCELDDVVRSEDFFCADGEKREKIDGLL